MRETGLVVSVFEQDLTTHLSVDASASATTLTVTDLAYFSPLGGLLAIRAPGAAEESVAYTGIDVVLNQITGVTPLVNAYPADDTVVSVYPYVTTRYAEVRIDGQHDTVRARVPLALWDRIGANVLSDSTGEGMRVEVELVSEYVVQDIIGADPAGVAPDLTVGSLEITESYMLDNGATGLHEQGTAVTLEGQQGAPQNAPLVTQDFEVVVAKVDPINELLGGADYTAYKASDRRGMFYDVAAGFIYYCGVGTGDLLVRKVSDVSGSAGTTVVFDGAYEKGSVTKVGANFYVLARRKSTGNYYVRQYDSSFAFITDWNVGPAPSSSTVLLTTDGTDLWYTWTSSANKLGGSRVSTADPTSSLEVWFSGSGFSTTDQVRGCVPNGTYDYGDAVSRFAAVYNNDSIRHWNDSTGVYEGYAPSPVNQVAGMMYGSDGNWYVMGDGPDTGTTYSVMYRLSSMFWPFSTTSVHHVGTTWYDSAGTTHETTVSPLKQATLERRKRVTVTSETIPAGGSDDPDSVRIYLARKATTPSNSELWRQTTLSPGVTTYTRSTQIATSGNNPPTVNDFPGGDAAVILSQEDGSGLDSQGLGLGWEIGGDGYAHGFSDCQVFTSSGTWNKPRVGGITTVEIVAIGGGGAGGSGMRNSGGNAAGGGGGGAGACVVIARFPITALNATEAVVVAGTAGGGAARTVNGQVGIDGTPGSDTTMTIGGTIKVRASGGLGGTGGGASGGPWAGGNAQNGSSTFESYEGAGGGDGGTAAPTAGTRTPFIFNNYYRQGAPGGGGGGGVQAGGAIASGAAGGAAFDLTGGAGGATNGTAGTSKGADLPFPGSGGGGGGGRTAGAAGDGGAGGAYGAGGGGGGGGQAQNSGAGGAGGAGIVVVRCY